MNKIVLIVVASLVLTFLFDFIMYKIEQRRELEKSWKAVNDQREREGKERWDGKNGKN